MKILTLILCLSLIGFSCSKDEEDTPPLATTFDTGVIRLGPEDCEYLIEIESITYKPLNLDPSFQANGVRVSGSYRKSAGVFTCGLKDLTYDQIQIVKLETL